MYIFFFFVETEENYQYFFISSAIFSGGGGILYHCSPFVSTVPSVCTKNGFRSITFEKTCVLDSYFTHRYIIIKYRSSSI